MRRLLLILLCLLSSTVLAHDGMQMTMPKETALGASAAFDSHGRLWVVDVLDKHVRLRHSDDNGGSLSEPMLVNSVAEPIYAEGENRPKIGFGPHDEIYVSWSQPRAKPWTGFVRFARSLDGGKHFETPLTVQHDRQEITHRFDAMAVDGKGRIVMAWIDKRDLEVATAKHQPYLGAAVYYSWSNDDGASFVPEHKLVDQSCECCRIALAKTPDGQIAAFFRNIYGDNIRDHAYAVLDVNGQPSHVERATYSQWHIAGCPHHGPGLAIGHDGVRHAVWYEANGQPTVWYGQLDPGHTPQHKLAIGHAGASHADVAASNQNVWIVWNQVGADGYTLMLRRSTDNGKHFDATRQLASSKDAVSSPQLLLEHGQPFVAWNTASGFRVIPVDASR